MKYRKSIFGVYFFLVSMKTGASVCNLHVLLLICLFPYSSFFVSVEGKPGELEKKACQALCRLKYEGDEAKEVSSNN